MQQQEQRTVKILYDQGQSGVDYSPFKSAARCPICGEWVKAHTAKLPSGAYRTRYHTCECGHRFKSIEYDPTRTSPSGRTL